MTADELGKNDGNADGVSKRHKNGINETGQGHIPELIVGENQVPILPVQKGPT